VPGQDSQQRQSLVAAGADRFTPGHLNPVWILRFPYLHRDKAGQKILKHVDPAIGINHCFDRVQYPGYKVRWTPLQSRKRDFEQWQSLFRSG